MADNLRIFYVHSGAETFVRMDHDFLSENFMVDDFYAIHKFPASFPSYLRGVMHCDVVFCWFASWNSFWALLFARLFRKPSVLVIGGYDLANIPEAQYGNQRGGLQKWVSRGTMYLATAVLTNSFYSQTEAWQNASFPTNRVKVIYHGVPDPFGNLADHRERMALTVGNVERSNLKRKGLEFFVRAAIHLPDVQFVVVGKWADDAIDYLREIAPPNVTFTGRVSESDLLDYYRRASVYVQASLHEGFGLSVAEAMLAGCIPVVTRVGSLPEVVGDCGIYAASHSDDDLAQSIQHALDAAAIARYQARQRILSHFPPELRQEKLEQMIIYLVQGSGANAPKK